VMTCADRAAAWLRKLSLRMAGGDGARGRAAGQGAPVVVGPAPCPVERIKQRWRWHFLVRAEQPAVMTRVLRYFAERFDVPKRDGLRVAIDRDPTALL